MNFRKLEDRIAWGNNVVARRVGRLTDAYRPDGGGDPLDPRNRYLRLPALFTAGAVGTGQASQYGSATCYARLDTAYTRPGDYLVREDQIVFIASQEPLHPVFCVRANMKLTLRRPSGPSAVGSTSYGGLLQSDSVPVLTNWPASVLGLGTSGSTWAGLPHDSAAPQWTVLLPGSHGMFLLPSDLVEGENGLRGSVVTAEKTHLGWRMIVRQGTS
jgi:hypothetical protein